MVQAPPTAALPWYGDGPWTSDGGGPSRPPLLRRCWTPELEAAASWARWRRCSSDADRRRADSGHTFGFVCPALRKFARHRPAARRTLDV